MQVCGNTHNPSSGIIKNMCHGVNSNYGAERLQMLGLQIKPLFLEQVNVNARCKQLHVTKHYQHMIP